MKTKEKKAAVKRSKSGSIKEKNAQGAIPFVEWFENKLFRLNEETYSLICSFDNSGYLSKTDSEKERKYRAYTSMLCELPSNIHYEEIVYNRPIDKDAYIKAIASKNGECNNKYEKAFFEIALSLKLLCQKEFPTEISSSSGTTPKTSKERVEAISETEIISLSNIKSPRALFIIRLTEFKL